MKHDDERLLLIVCWLLYGLDFGVNAETISCYQLLLM